MPAESDEESTVSTVPRVSRLPAGTIPGIIILGILIVLVIAMLRAAGGSDAAAAAGQQPDHSHAERRDADDPFALGPVDAPVGLVVFSDYQCPFCARWNHDTLPLMKERAEDGELRIEWRDVNVYGPDSRRAALAAHAAAAQGAYWEYHDALFPDGRIRSENELARAGLLDLADELGLDRDRFAADMDSPEAAEAIARNEQLGVEHGASATPVFFLGGVPHVGAQPTDVFMDAFDDALDSSGH